MGKITRPRLHKKDDKTYFPFLCRINLLISDIGSVAVSAASFSVIQGEKMTNKPVSAKDVETKKGVTGYPPELAACVSGRAKRGLGDIFGLKNFGVNLTDLDPGSASALYHHHTTQDEFVFVVSGVATVKVGDEEFELSAGECIGFPAGSGIGHQVLNKSRDKVSYLEVGDRSSNDNVEYPNDDIRATADDNGMWVFTRKNGDSF